MIRVTVELISAHGPTYNKKLGVMDIANDGGSKNAHRGDYIGQLYRKSSLPKDQFCKSTGILRKAKTKDYPRLSYNVWRLVTRMLRELFPEETYTPEKTMHDLPADPDSINEENKG